MRLLGNRRDEERVAAFDSNVSAMATRRATPALARR